MTSGKDRYRILRQNLNAQREKRGRECLKEDGNYEVLHSCENMGWQKSIFGFRNVLGGLSSVAVRKTISIS